MEKNNSANQSLQTLLVMIQEEDEDKAEEKPLKLVSSSTINQKKIVKD